MFLIASLKNSKIKFFSKTKKKIRNVDYKQARKNHSKEKNEK